MDLGAIFYRNCWLAGALRNEQSRRPTPVPAEPYDLLEKNRHKRKKVMSGEIGYDVFISHASEDKDSLARPLSNALSRKGLVVWFDEQVLNPGDSLQDRIDQGLASSRIGVVILSKNFFQKQWTKKELGGLFALSIGKGRRVIPVWHEISYQTVLEYSPMLADSLAIHSSQGIEAVSDSIKAMAYPLQWSVELIELGNIAQIRHLISSGDLVRALERTTRLVTIDGTTLPMATRMILGEVEAIHAGLLLSIGNIDGASNYIDSRLSQSDEGALFPPYRLAFQLLADSLSGKPNQKIAAAQIAPSSLSIPGSPVKSDVVLVACNALFVTGHYELVLRALAMAPHLGKASGSSSSQYHWFELECHWMKNDYAGYLLASSNLSKRFSADDFLDRSLDASARVRRMRAHMYLRQWDEAIHCQQELEHVAAIDSPQVQSSVAWARAYKVRAQRCNGAVVEAQIWAEQFLQNYAVPHRVDAYEEQIAYVLVEGAYCAKDQLDPIAVGTWLDRLDDFLLQRHGTQLHSERCFGLNALGQTFKNLGDFDESLRVCEKLEAISTGLLAEYKGARALSPTLKAEVLVRRFVNGVSGIRKDLVSAKTLIESALAISRTPHCLGTLAFIHFLQEDVEMAKQNVLAAWELGGTDWVYDEIIESLHASGTYHQDFLSFVERMTNPLGIGQQV